MLVSLPVFADDKFIEDEQNLEEGLIYSITRTDKEMQADLDEQVNIILDKLNSTTRGYGDIYETEVVSTKYANIQGYVMQYPTNGTQFPTGGGFYIDTQGGSDWYLNVTFPQPFGAVSIGVPLGSGSTSNNGGIYCQAPDTVNFFKPYGSKTYKMQALTVWAIDRYTGEREVYGRTTTKTLYTESFYSKKVN